MSVIFLSLKAKSQTAFDVWFLYMVFSSTKKCKSAYQKENFRCSIFNTTYNTSWHLDIWFGKCIVLNFKNRCPYAIHLLLNLFFYVFTRLLPGPEASITLIFENVLLRNEWIISWPEEQNLTQHCNFYIGIYTYFLYLKLLVSIPKRRFRYSILNTTRTTSLLSGYLVWQVYSPWFYKLAPSCQTDIGLIQVKEEGWRGVSEGWQGCSEGFPEGEARGKSRGAALPAQGKPRPSRLFYSDLHSI